MIAEPRTADNRDTMVEAATNYAAFGWRVFPCNRDKRPLTATGFKEASADPNQIMEWWERWPDALIGIACGASDIVVIDHDPGHDVAGSGQQRLASLLGDVRTRQARTGSGGEHYYFRAPTGMEIRNSAGLLATGVDIRGEGGYVIAPPSTSQIGAYSWTNRDPLALLPDVIVGALKTEAGAVRPAVTSGDGQTIPVGRRNETLFRDACALRRRGLSPLAIEAAIVQQNADRCEIPLTEEQAREAARSALRYPTAESPITVPPDGLPHAELVADDAVTVTIAVGPEVAGTFAFTEMFKAKRDLASVLEVSISGDPDTYTRRINIDSSTAQDSLRSYLKALYPDYNWQRILNRVCSMARRTFLGQDRSQDATEIPRPIGRPKDLVSPFMPRDGGTIFFGDGGSLKSYVSLYLATLGQAQPVDGLYPVPNSPVMYLDYEADPETFAERYDRIMAGFGARSSPGVIYARGGGVPLADQWEAIARVCNQKSVGWLVVDSIGVAAGDDLLDQSTVTRFFSAIQRIGRPALLIAHISKSRDADTRYPFGSVYWHNFARRTWYVKGRDQQDQDHRLVRLECKKTNDSRWPKPQNILVTFEGDNGPVRFAPGQQPVDTMSPKDRIFAALTEPRTVATIAALTDLGEPAVDNTLRRHPNSFVVIESSAPSGTGRPPRLWARKSNQEVPF